MKKTLKMLSLVLLIIGILSIAIACGSENIAVTEITLDKTSAEMSVGEELQLNATITPTDATDKTVTWETSNQEIATVVGGKVTAVKVGQATITAKAGDKSATCTVNVKAVETDVAVTGVTLNQTSAVLNMNDEVTLVATVLPANATNKTVTWETSNPQVATVVNGKVTAVGSGEATITAKAGDKSATATINVVSVITSVTLQQTTYNVDYSSDKITLTPVVEPAGTQWKKIEWSSNNEEVATVEDGIVTLVSVGTAKIKAKINDGAFEVEATINVDYVKHNIASVDDFFDIADATKNDKYTLTSDINLVCNEKEIFTAPNNSAWELATIDSVNVYCLIPSFKGVLDGNGHKVTLTSTTMLNGGGDLSGGESNWHGNGLFGEIKGLIENVNFDINIASLGNIKPGGFDAIAYSIKDGSLKNSYVKVNLGSVASCTATATSQVINLANENSVIENNIFEINDKVFVTIGGMIYTGESEDLAVQNRALAAAIKKNIIVTNTSGVKLYDQVVAGRSIIRHIGPADIAIYSSTIDLFDLENFGYCFNTDGRTLTVDKNYFSTANSHHHLPDVAANTRTSKLTFNNDSWTFDYTNNTIKLCNKEVVSVVDSSIEVSDLTEFEAMITNATQADKYVLKNDITITNNETAAQYAYKFADFKGTLNGDGHKITYNIALTGNATGVRGAALFSSLSGKIENVNFDITLTKGEETWAAGYSALIAQTLTGTLQNCFVKVSDIDGFEGEEYNLYTVSIVRSISGNSKLVNNVYDLTAWDKIIIAGAYNKAAQTNPATGNEVQNQIALVSSYRKLFAAKNNNTASNPAEVETSVMYTSLAEMLDGTSVGYQADSNTVRTARFELPANDSWTFDYTNHVIKLCGNTVLTQNV